MKQPGSFTVHTGHAGPLFYAEAGSGFPLLLLHGNGEDHTYFRRSSASSRSIITFSRRIRADTEPPRAEAAPSRWNALRTIFWNSCMRGR